MLRTSSQSLFALPIFLMVAACPAAMAQSGNAPPKINTAFPAETIYPESAQAGGEQGEVIVGVFIGSDGGRPQKYRVDHSSGYTDLDLAAIQSVLNWRFLPGNQNGSTVADWMEVKVVYNLPPAPAATPTQSGLH